VRDEIDASLDSTVLFQSGFVIYQGDDYLTILWYTRLPYEDEVSVRYPFLIHRISLSSEEEVFVCRGEELLRYRNLGFDIFLGEYGHTTGDGSDERDMTDFVAICRILR
jgi:hypothetical protein